MGEHRDLDELGDGLENVLGRLEREVEKILDGSLDIFDPDESMRILDDATLAISQGAEEIARHEAAAPCAQAELDHLAEAALAAAVQNASFPVVVSSSWCHEIPPLEIPAGGLDAILGILARRVVAFAGSAGRIHATTRLVDDYALFSIEGGRHAEPVEGSTEPDLAFESVEDLIQDLGGQLRVHATDLVAEVDLMLPLGVRAR